WRGGTSPALREPKKCAGNWRVGEKSCARSMGDSSSGLLTDLLKQVSRSFYLTMRVLPCAIRPQIGLAYLLARTTDTIADTQLVPPVERLQALQALRERILGNSSAPLSLANWPGSKARRRSGACYNGSKNRWRCLENSRWKTSNASAMCWCSSPAGRSWT